MLRVVITICDPGTTSRDTGFATQPALSWGTQTGGKPKPRLLSCFAFLHQESTQRGVRILKDKGAKRNPRGWGWEENTARRGRNYSSQ